MRSLEVGAQLRERRIAVAVVGKPLQLGFQLGVGDVVRVHLRGRLALVVDVMVHEHGYPVVVDVHVVDHVDRPRDARLHVLGVAHRVGDVVVAGRGRVHGAARLDVVGEEALLLVVGACPRLDVVFALPDIGVLVAVDLHDDSAVFEWRGRRRPGAARGQRGTVHRRRDDDDCDDHHDSGKRDDEGPLVATVRLRALCAGPPDVPAALGLEAAWPPRRYDVCAW